VTAHLTVGVVRRRWMKSRALRLATSAAHAMSAERFEASTAATPTAVQNVAPKRTRTFGGYIRGSTGRVKHMRVCGRSCRKQHVTYPQQPEHAGAAAAGEAHARQVVPEGCRGGGETGDDGAAPAPAGPLAVPFLRQRGVRVRIR